MDPILQMMTKPFLEALKSPSSDYFDGRTLDALLKMKCGISEDNISGLRVMTKVNIDPICDGENWSSIAKHFEENFWQSSSEKKPSKQRALTENDKDFVKCFLSLSGISVKNIDEFGEEDGCLLENKIPDEVVSNILGEKQLCVDEESLDMYKKQILLEEEGKEYDEDSDSDDEGDSFPDEDTNEEEFVLEEEPSIVTTSEGIRKYRFESDNPNPKEEKISIEEDVLIKDPSIFLKASSSKFMNELNFKEDDYKEGFDSTKYLNTLRNRIFENARDFEVDYGIFSYCKPKEASPGKPQTNSKKSEIKSQPVPFENLSTARNPSVSLSKNLGGSQKLKSSSLKKIRGAPKSSEDFDKKFSSDIFKDKH